MSGKMDTTSTLTPTYSLSWTDNAKETAESLRSQKPQDTPLRLYDIEEHQVVSKNDVCYAILSYVWNQWTRGGLQSIVEHMVRECGLRYVWVDAWCINQTDPDEKVKEIGRMSTYYRHAAVGLVLLPDWTDRKDDVVWAVTMGQWADRVWTLQEGALLSKALIVGHDSVADDRDYASQLGPSIGGTVPLAGSKMIEGMLYESFEEAWDDTGRGCSVKEDLIWGYTAVVRGAHMIVGKYGREWHSLLREAAEAGCITAGLFALGPPERDPGRSWMGEVSTRPSGDYTMRSSYLPQSSHFDAVEITDTGLVTQGTIVTVEIGKHVIDQTSLQLTSHEDGFVWTVRCRRSLNGDGGEKGARGIIFTQNEEVDGNTAVLLVAEKVLPLVYHRIEWTLVDTPIVQLRKWRVCIA